MTTLLENIHSRWQEPFSYSASERASRLTHERGVLSIWFLQSGGQGPLSSGRRSTSSRRRTPIRRADTRPREQNRSQVARWLLGLLLLVTVLVFVLIWYEPEPDVGLVRDVFRALAGLAGLVGWFYFGRPHRRKRLPRELHVEASLHIEQRDAPVKP